MDIIIFSGQSNMVGETECLSETETVDNAWEYRFLTDELLPLHNPVGENIGHNYEEMIFSESIAGAQWNNSIILEGSCRGNTNMVPSFARAYIAETGHQITAVHAAKGSTYISDWLPGSESYNAIICKYKAAVKKIGADNVDNVFIVWLQGESDMLRGTAKNQYKEALLVLKNALLRDTGAKAFGIIRVGQFAVYAGWINMTTEQRIENDRAIVEAQEEICNEDKDFLLLTRITQELLTGDKKYVNPNVGGHFSALGLETLGNAAGKNLGEWVKTHGEN